MTVKLFFAGLFVLLFKLNSVAQSQPQLAKPPGWETEKFTLPPSFAPTLPLTGKEDIRFSPQWSKKNAAGYWAYCFLWTVEGAAVINTSELEKYLTQYYTGLIKANLAGAKRDTVLAVPVSVKLHQSLAKAGQPTYEGRLTMPDYMSDQPISLNVRIRVRKPQNGDTALFVMICRQPFTHPLWKQLEQVGNQQ